jgi:hypothetical protein
MGTRHWRGGSHRAVPAGAPGGHPTEIRLVAQAPDAGAGMGTKSDAALERSHRIDLAWLVR